MDTEPAAGGRLEPGYRSALLTGAALNFLMFLVEGAVGLWIGSAALTADAADFLEDTGMYSLGLFAIGWTARGRAAAGMAMGLAMFGVGLTALWQVAMRLIGGGAPTSLLMGGTATAALAVNVYCAYRLVRYQRGDASMRSIWLSTRNDAILNTLTIAAAAAVWITRGGWPDILAGSVIAAVNLLASMEVLRDSRRDLRAEDGSPRNR